MKIGILIDELVPGGLQKVAIRECEGLQRKGNQVTLLVLSKRNNNQLKDITKHIKIEYLEDKLPKWQKVSFRFPVFAYFSLFHLTYPLFLPAKIRAGEFDIILAHGSFVCPTALAIKRKHKIPVVSFIWDPASYIIPKAYSKTLLKTFFPIMVPLAKIFDKAIIKKSDLIVSSCPCDYTNDIVPSAYDGPKEIPQKDYQLGYFLSVTKWNAGKNPFFLLEILENVPEMELKVVGAWENKELLKEFHNAILKRGLSKRVEVIGEVTQNALGNLYRKAGAFIYPNFEAFGMGALEAAAYANPIIMPKGSGVLHFISKESGIFPKEGDLQGFISAVKKLMIEPQQAKKMGVEAFNSAQNLRWENHVQKIETMLKKAAGKKMLAFNLGFISGRSISGGDVLFMDLVKDLAATLRSKNKPQLDVTIVVPKKGMEHWQRQGEVENVKFVVLKPNFFDKFESPVAIFLTYLVRSLQALRLRKFYHYYYSCSDVWPDIFPAFILRFFHKQTIWISRIYHIYLTPKQRKGNLLVNIASTGLQRVSWFMMKLKSQKIFALNEKLAVDLVRYGFCHSEQSGQAGSAKDLALNDVRLPVLGAGVDLSLIKPIQPAKKGFNTVYLGRLARTKGIYDLVEAWRKVVEQNPKAGLAIIGGGQQEVVDILKSKIKETGLQKNITLLGFIPSKEEVYAILKASQVFVLPSHEEGWGIVVAEAMACGLPVVGYNLDIFGQVYKKGFVTAPLFDTQELSKRIAELLNNKAFRLRLSKEALTESARFDNSAITSQFASIL